MATTAAKEAMAIKYGNMTGHSIKKIFKAPVAGKHPKPMRNGTEAAVAEAAVTAAEAIAVADLEETNRLAAEFEALAVAPSSWRSLRRPNTGTPCASAGSHASGSACRSAVQAGRSTPIKAFRSLECSNALILNVIITSNFIIGVYLYG
jgi:hypothetical protein